MLTVKTPDEALEVKRQLLLYSRRGKRTVGSGGGAGSL